MNIALLGYGRMGKTIEQIALQRGHKIVLKVDENTHEYDIRIADCAIDFSIPTVAYSNISNCLLNKIPVVSGTTGWLNQYIDATNLCKVEQGAFIYASNFSVGVNIFFELNAYLAKMMKNLNSYNVSIEEIHHVNKLDAPSGTAITLAEGVIANNAAKSWALDVTKNENEIPITSKRIPDVPGTHTVDYYSEVDSISIKHVAHNRNGFALGAVLAAEWLVGKKGIYTMKDVLGINKNL
ncbi:4-hydroxy-tetrahydrodipicolinate reductase [Lutibacter sp.]|uniref:4-hydroxy-tetrahydrodipicolinate reductase n=1 Tax=Lutibacter sp. TaxID=1925666 RepID=UPI002736EFEB|nr:4-hydroxy-tetrahydrodipicolinate reductase [Lutibacter sp.]MDP3314248.1 4-hydroxy-tetrahydrodipicolinate reductase [Lutibacter sp.]